jgi:hypothetical protein
LPSIRDLGEDVQAIRLNSISPTTAEPPILLDGNKWRQSDQPGHSIGSS